MSDLKIKELKLVIQRDQKLKANNKVAPLAIEFPINNDVTPRAFENVIDKWTGGSSGRLTTDLSHRDFERDGVTSNHRKCYISD